MNKYEIIDENKKRDDYEFLIKDLNNNQIYSIFFLKLKDKIEIINEFKNNRKFLNYNNDKMITSDYEEVFINNIPDNLKNEEFYITILSKDGYLIKFFDENDITFNMCLAAIKNQPFAIRHVPKNLINDELIDTAIDLNGYSIMYVDNDKKTDDRCIRAYNNCATALRFMPKYLVTYDLCIEAVKREMYCLQYVPDEYLLDVYQHAVLDAGKDIPKKGYPGVNNDLIRKYRDIQTRLDKLNAIKNENKETSNEIVYEEEISFDDEQARYEWLLNRRENLLQELNMIDSELMSFEISKHK